MKFGVNVLNFGPGTTPETMRGWADFAVRSGFDLLMISDHVAVTRDVQAGFPAPFYDPFLALAWLAPFSGELEIGTTVTILPYRHPLQTARLTANLDRLSGGRFIFGAGVGWARQEFAALGVPFEQRGALADEYLDVIKRCWTGDVVSYQGRFVSFQDVQTGPRPVQKPHPPIWVGGASRAALRRAVRFGDAWHPYRARIPWLRDEGLPMLRELAAAAGKPAPSLCPRVPLRLTTTPLPEDQRIAGHGTLAQIRADLVALHEMGAPYVLLDTYTGDPEQTRHPEEDWELLSLQAEQVLPEFRD